MITGFLLFFIGLVFLGLIGLTLSFSISSIFERENRAAACGGLLFLFLWNCLLLYGVLWARGFFSTLAGGILLVGMTGITAVSGWMLFRRSGENSKALEGASGLIVGDVDRFDERETVFERDNLKEGTPEYTEFYQRHPAWEKRDAQRRQKGGPLGEIGAIDKPHGEFNSAATIAAALMPAHLTRPHMIRPVNFTGKNQSVGPEEAACRVKGFARSLGADLVGITRVNPLWTYSHRGMGGRQIGEDWGQPLEVMHEYIVVIATEMAFDLVQTAPHTADIIETTRNYAEGAFITTCLAQFIANLGYSATPDHFTHYETLLVPLAVDAGLGELGRHGYLITNALGSRLRLAAVTTDLPLLPDKPVDMGVADFCAICKKCADSCPSGSIPKGDAEEVNGTLRWKLNADTCHDYWGRIGTDCNICMRVCPYSHDKTFPHKIVNWAVSRNTRARRLFLTMDDLFYGRKPKPKAPPPWASFSPDSALKGKSG